MLTTLLLVLAAVAAVVAACAATLAVAVRRPALVTRLARITPIRRLMVWITQAQIRRARRRGDVPAGATDLEVVLAGQTGPEAEAARATLARMNPRQRAEFSRRTLGADGLAAMMQTAATSAGDTGVAVGRADRRRTADLAATSGPARTAQQRKAVARRRAARKANRTR